MRLRPLYRLVLLSLLAFAGCAIPPDAPISETGAVREYFWPSGGVLKYDVYNGLNTSPIEHTVTITPFGDTLHAIDESNGHTGRIDSRIGLDGVFLVDVQGTALFPLPDGAYISRYSSEQKIKQYQALTNFLTFEGGVVAFAKGVTYRTIDKTTWSYTSSSVSEPVTATCAVSATRLYAGTSTGDLYLSEDAGKNWINIKTQLGGPIRSILSNENTIYLAIDSVGVFSLKGSSFLPVGTQPMPRQLAGIAFLPAVQGKYILAATRDQGLMKTYISGNEPWRPLQPTISGEVIRGVYSKDATVLVTMPNGKFYTSIDTANTWQDAAAPLEANEQFSAAEISAGHAAMATNAGRIFATTLEKPSPQALGSISAEIHAVAPYGDGALAVASQRGLTKITTSGDQSAVGPFQTVVDSARGEFALLQSLTGGAISVGDSWHAGNLYLPQSPLPNKYFPITARVLEQLDSLKVDDVEFSDVFVIRYAFESSGVPFPESPYWMIYFSRGIGPVMIDQIPSESQLTAPLSRAVYKGRK